MAIVTDNSSNMTKTVKIFDDKEDVALGHEKEECETEGDRILLNVYHMRCAVHMSAVMNALNSKQIFVPLLQVPIIARKLRTPNVFRVIKKVQKLCPSGLCH